MTTQPTVNGTSDYILIELHHVKDCFVDSTQEYRLPANKLEGLELYLKIVQSPVGLILKESNGEKERGL